jgi:hypothetical protein
LRKEGTFKRKVRKKKRVKATFNRSCSYLSRTSEDGYSFYSLCKVDNKPARYREQQGQKSPGWGQRTCLKNNQ